MQEIRVDEHGVPRFVRVYQHAGVTLMDEEWGDLLGAMKYATAERERLLARVAELETELDGEKKANALLNAGMGAVCEGRDELKHRVRALETALTQMRTFIAPVNLAGPQEAVRIADHVLKGS